MPKLQGFAWHIETVYNPNKIGEKKKKKRKKRKSTASFIPKTRESKQKTKTVFVMDSKGLRKEKREIKNQNFKAWRYYSHKKYGYLRHTRTLGIVMYFINSNKKVYKVNKQLFEKWKSEGVIRKASLYEIQK